MNDPYEPRPGHDPQRSVPQYGQYAGDSNGPWYGHESGPAGADPRAGDTPPYGYGDPAYRTQYAGAGQTPGRSRKRFSGGSLIAGMLLAALIGAIVVSRPDIGAGPEASGAGSAGAGSAAAPAARDGGAG